ncbi:MULTISPECIES: YceI family protein [unclassified Mycobacterium]|uniref:YceI family protein n=1 Tax=unclassified Mycobacterium TaxID=2642494 RepID=UPI0029C75062|nr:MULTISPECIES: YceI family protein [unclassified Mycobacterium]
MADVSDLLAGPSSTWALDAARTTVGFHSPSFWGLLKVKGTFTKVEGTGQATAPDFVGGHVRIDATSVSTGIGKRDAHLRSADFFDVEKYPTIGLTLDKAVVTGPSTLELNTTIMIRGIEQRLDLPATVTVLDGGAVRIVTKAELNRQEFGVDGNLAGMMGDIATVEATAVFVKQS